MKDNYKINYVPLDFTILPRTDISSLVNDSSDSTNTNFFNDSLLIVIGQLVVIAVIILVTIVGNCIVVIIIWRSKKLHNVGMYLIASLAVCDALVGLAVMPFKTAFQINGSWPFNRSLCELWMFLDVSLCTASIWHLCAIGMDRLWIFSYELSYITKRNYKVTLSLLAVISVLTFGISLPLLLYPWENSDTQSNCSIPGNWRLRSLCELWMFLDASLCTASIWHLCAIGMDRLWIFSYELSYITKRNYKVTLSLLVVMSVLTFGISLPLLLYPWENSDTQSNCSIPDSYAYTLYSTIGAFYLPFLILTIIYLRMYILARRRWEKKKRHSSSFNLKTAGAGGKNNAAKDIDEENGDVALEDLNTPKLKLLAVSLSPQRNNSCKQATTTTTVNATTSLPSPATTTPSTQNGHSISPLAQKLASSSITPGSTLAQKLSQQSSSGSGLTLAQKLSQSAPNAKLSTTSNSLRLPGVSPIFAVSRMRGRINQWKKRAAEKRERRAIMTLFIILATFAVCWLPFFLIALIVPFCGAKCQPPYFLSLLIDWLGYLNSTLNPIIYALMNDDLRQAFKELIHRQ
ncbi:5-hydroxytryptamine receptor 1A-like [Convolutriloba macropyga]|uniref:5-hydroxytryptamine receptor 1A-like n=1 Tax=Convolutriloba macropyga TaxID=536237 RepID=UPI003F51B30B